MRNALVVAAPTAPLVALVGRPNVGKSTLFNRLVRRRQALMHDQPGVTRDRLFGAFLLDDSHNQTHAVRLVDTGGLTAPGEDALSDAMMAQTRRAIDEAAWVLLVVDGRAGLLPDDAAAARLLRRAGANFAVVVNKVDLTRQASMAADFYALGASDVLDLSAEHARNIDALRELLAKHLEAAERLDATTRWQAPDDDFAGDTAELAPDAAQAVHEDAALLAADAALGGDHPDLLTQEEDALDAAEQEQSEGTAERIEWQGGAIRVAVVGRPNAGKSSLINAVLGEERMVASPEAGTTRDVIDVPAQVNGQDFVLLDTAGIRRQRAVDSRLEGLMVHMARVTLARADVVVLVVDATQRPSDQDAKIAAMAHEAGVGLVLAANKWDLVENPTWQENFLPALRHDLPFVSYAPVVHTSASTGVGLNDLFAAVHDVQRERHRRVGTGTLNRFFRQVVASHPPPMRKGVRPALAFVSQPMVRPPTFVVSAKRAEGLGETYRRYLINALRQRFGFGGTPLWVKFRSAPRRSRPGYGARKKVGRVGSAPTRR